MAEEQQQRTAGRPRSADHECTKAEIRRLKCTINPQTGKVFTFKEIGAKLGISGQGAAFYLSGETGNCPTCHRPLEKLE